MVSARVGAGVGLVRLLVKVVVVVDLSAGVFVSVEVVVVVALRQSATAGGRKIIRLEATKALRQLRWWTPERIVVAAEGSVVRMANTVEAEAAAGERRRRGWRYLTRSPFSAWRIFDVGSGGTLR